MAKAEKAQAQEQEVEEFKGLVDRAGNTHTDLAIVDVVLALWELEQDSEILYLGIKDEQETFQAIPQGTPGVSRERAVRIQQMWRDGLELPQIAAALNSTRNAVSVDFARLRNAGWPLPYRYNIHRPANPHCLL